VDVLSVVALVRQIVVPKCYRLAHELAVRPAGRVRRLGCGLIKPHPYACGCDEDSGEIVSGGLFVSRCDFSEALEFIEETLDEIALAVDRRLDRALHLAVALGGDVATSAMCGGQVEDGASGRPRASTMALILVLSPPRERPRV